MVRIVRVCFQETQRYPSFLCRTETDYDCGSEWKREEVQIYHCIFSSSKAMV